MESKKGIERVLIGLLIRELGLTGDKSEQIIKTAKEIIDFLEEEGNLNLHPVMVKYYDPKLSNHDKDENATQCYKSLDKAYFSMTGTEFDYMLNGLQNKIVAYREIRGE